MWITRYPWNVLASRRTALYPSSSGFVVSFRRVQLGGPWVRRARANAADVHDAVDFSCIVTLQLLPCLI